MHVLFTFLLAASPVANAADLIYIGDSQSASEGTLLAKLLPTLTAHNRIVAGNASCGTTIVDHLKGGPAHCKYPSLQHMTAKDGNVSFSGGGGHVSPIEALLRANGSAGTVVVELGDNHYSGANVDPKLESKARTMATQILSSGRRCIWIGPASIEGTSPACAKTGPSKRAVSQILKRTLNETSVNGKKCEFVDSFQLTSLNPPHSDDPLCIHYVRRGSPRYGEWADAIRPTLSKALDGGAASNRLPDENSSRSRRSVK